MKRSALFPMLVLAAGMLAQPAAAAPAVGPALGEPAPEFALRTLDGRLVRLADYRGKTLVINVWGSWCPPCRLETPDLSAEAKRLASHGVAFLGVDTTESASAVRAFVVAKGIPYPQVAIANDSPFARAYDIRNYPTTFVIGPDGVLRARHADNLLPRAQLRAYISAAQAGASAPLQSAFQTQLDALLDPARYPFTGDPATIRANVAQALDAIARADAMMDDAMDDASRDHDLVATQAQEQRLRAAALAAFAPLASGDSDDALLARLHAEDAAARGAWSEAATWYARRLRFMPDDVDALGGAAYAAAQTGDSARAAELDARIVELAPTTASLVTLGRAQAQRGDLAAAEAAFARATALAASPSQLAWANLYAGRMEASAGRSARARDAFARALAAATRIPATNPRGAWYVEQAQEGAIALGVVAGAAPSLSLAPWTGPDLPGSIASTIKYRLAVTGARGSSLTLAVRGLPLHWIGSFCTDRVCAPQRTVIVIPPGGAKIVEFQVVPYGRATGAVDVRIDASAGPRVVATAGARVSG